MPSQRPESGGVAVEDLESTAKLPVLDVAAIDDMDVEDESHLRTTVLPPDAFATSETHPGIPILKEPTGLASEDVRVVVREAAAASAAAREQGDSRVAAEAEAAVGRLLERQAELLREMQEVREEAEARYQRLENDLDAARRLGEDLDAMRREAEARTLAAEQRVAALEAEFAAARDQLEAGARAAATTLRRTLEEESVAARQRHAAAVSVLRQQHETALAAAEAQHRAESAGLLERRESEAAALRAQGEASLVELRQRLEGAHEASRRELGAESAALRDQVAVQSADHGAALQTARDEAAELGRQLVALRGLKAQDEMALAGAREEIAALGRSLEAAREGLSSAERGAHQSLTERGRELERTRAELTELKALAAAQVEALQAAESRRGIWASLLGDAESSHDSQLREASEAADAERERAIAAQTELEARMRQQGEREATLRAEIDSAAARCEEADRRAEDLRTALAQAQGALVTARADADGQAARLAEFEARLDALQARERAAVEQAEAASAIGAELARQLQALQHKLEVTEPATRAELDALRTEKDALRAEHGSLLERHAALGTAAEAAAARAAALEARLGAEDPADSLRTVQGELRRGVERITELESDLRAAEDQINRLEGELRVKSARLEELARAPWPTHGGAPEVTSIGTRRRDEYAARGRDAVGAGESMLASDSAFSGAGAAASADGVTRYFVLMDGDTEIVHVLGRRTTIGRGLDNDVRIDTKFISRHHAVVLAGPNQTVVEDLRSTNGVLVNGRRVTRSVLRDGDIVHVGKTQFRFVQRHRER